MYTISYIVYILAVHTYFCVSTLLGALAYSFFNFCMYSTLFCTVWVGMSFEELCLVKSQTWMDWVSYISTWTLWNCPYCLIPDSHFRTLAWPSFVSHQTLWILQTIISMVNFQKNGRPWQVFKSWTFQIINLKVIFLYLSMAWYVLWTFQLYILLVIVLYQHLTTSCSLNHFNRKTFDYWTWHIISSQAPFLHSWEGKLQKLVSRCFIHSSLNMTHVQSNITLS